MWVKNASRIELRASRRLPQAVFLASLDCCTLVGASLGPWVGAWTEIEAGIEAGIATRGEAGTRGGIVGGIEVGIVAGTARGIATRNEARTVTGIAAGSETGIAAWIGTLTQTNFEGEMQGKIKVQIQCWMKSLVWWTLGVLGLQGCVTMTLH